MIINEFCEKLLIHYLLSDDIFSEKTIVKNFLKKTTHNNISFKDILNSELDLRDKIFCVYFFFDLTIEEEKQIAFSIVKIASKMQSLNNDLKNCLKTIEEYILGTQNILSLNHATQLAKKYADKIPGKDNIALAKACTAAAIWELGEELLNIENWGIKGRGFYNSSLSTMFAIKIFPDKTMEIASNQIFSKITEILSLRTQND
jgi:hypothetical protein